MNSSVEAYNKLAELDKTLPVMNSASLKVLSNIKNFSELKGFVEGYAEGWATLSDQVVITMDVNQITEIITNPKLLEAEFLSEDADRTLHIRNVNGDRYVVTEYLLGSDEQDSDQAYVDTQVYVRHDLAKKFGWHIVNYRTWYKRLEDGSFAGRWEPIVQQFMGFDKVD